MGANLGKLRAVLDVARTLQSSFSMRRRAGLGRGCGAGDHGRGARIPAAARTTASWRSGWRARATARNSAQTRPARAARVIHRALRAAPRPALHEFRLRPAPTSVPSTASPIWSCAASSACRWCGSEPAGRGHQHAGDGRTRRWACSTWIRAWSRPTWPAAIANCCRRWRSKPPPSSKTRACWRRSAPSRRSRKS